MGPEITNSQVMLLLGMLEPHFDLQGYMALKAIIGLCKYETIEITKKEGRQRREGAKG